jgi:NhaP-type Na+/H+ or K+/H+ antiporter
MAGFFRALTIIVLGLAVVGFGICSLCGGVIGVNAFMSNKRSDADIGWLAFGLSGLGVLLTWLSWWGLRKMRIRRDDPVVEATPAAANPPERPPHDGAA